MSYVFTNANGTVASNDLSVVVLVPPTVYSAKNLVVIVDTNNVLGETTNLANLITTVPNATNSWGIYSNSGVFSGPGVNVNSGVFTASVGTLSETNPFVNTITNSFTNSFGLGTNITINVQVLEQPIVSTNVAVKQIPVNVGRTNISGLFSSTSYGPNTVGIYSGLGIVDATNGILDTTTTNLSLTGVAPLPNYVTFTISNSYGLVASATVDIEILKLPTATFSPAVFVTDQDGGVTNLSSLLSLTPNSPGSPTGFFSGTGITNAVTGAFDPSTPGLTKSDVTLRTNWVYYAFTNSYGVSLATNALLGIVDYAMPVAIPPPATTNCTTDAAFPLAGLFTVTNNAASGGFVFTSSSSALSDGIFTPASALAAVNLINYTFTNSSIVSGTNLSVSGSFNLYANDDCGGAQPTLTIQLVNATNVDLKWFGSFQLQSAPDLGGMGTNWSLVSTGGFNSQNSVIQSNVATNHVFYRLFKN